MEEDRVARLVEDFRRLRPEIDPHNKAVAARLLRLSDLAQHYYGAIAERFDVSLSGLGVLTALARSSPLELTPTDLNRDILVTSGGITFLTTRLERQGFVAKRPHPSDGRAVLVGLTRRGRQVADELIDAVALADMAALADFSVSDLSKADEFLIRLQAGIESVMSRQQEMESITKTRERSSGASRR